MRKSFLLVLLTALLVFGLVASASAQDADTPEYAQKLKAVGIIEGDEGGLRLDDTITRAEFATMTVRALGFGRYAAATTQFSDVTATNHWAGGYINVAAGQKIINGYPDGTFRPDQNVTYNEAITMLVRMLGYGPACPEENWPVSYLAKAAQLGVTSGVTFDAGTAATRGDVFQMLENSIDIDMMEQTGYGDDVRYEEVDKTILNDYLDYDEIEGTVVNIARVDEDLDDNEFEIAVTEVNGEEDEFVEEYTLLAGSPAALFGMDVKAWVNSDDEVVWIANTTDEDDIKLDTIMLVMDGTEVQEDKILTYVEDEEYDLDEDVVIYINDEKEDFDELEKQIKAGNVPFGVAILNDKGDVRFMNVCYSDFNGVVTEVNDEEIEYFEKTDRTKTLDLTDYDEYYISNKYGQALTLEDINEDSVIYVRENDDDEVFVTVVNEKVEGDLEKIKDDSVTVDGESIDKGLAATMSDDFDESVKDYDADDTMAENLAGEEVVVLLDINGELRHIRGDAESKSGLMFGIVVGQSSAGFDYEVKILNQDGNKVAYAFDEDKDFEFFVDPNLEQDFEPIVAYKLDSDGEIADGEFYVYNGAKFVDRDGSTLPDYEVVAAGVEVNAFDDDDYIVLRDLTKVYVEDDTVIFRNDGDEELVEWANIENTSDTSGIKLVILKKAKGSDAALIVFTDGYENVSTDLEYGVVLQSPWYEDDGDNNGWKVEVDVFDEGIQEYFIDGNRDCLTEGNAVQFKLNADNEIHSVIANVYSDTVYDVDGKYLKLGDAEETADWVRIDRDAVVYLLEDDRDIDTKKDYADIDEGDTVEYVLDDGVIVALVITTEAEEPPTEPKGIKFVYKDNKMTVSGVVYNSEGDNDYILRVSGDALEVAVYSPVGVWDAENKKLTFKLDDLIPANGIYNVELINKKDYDTVIATEREYMEKNVSESK